MNTLPLDLKEKVEVAFDLHQAGNIIFTEQEINDLNLYVVNEYDSSIDYLQSTPVIFKKALFVLIVNIAKKWGINNNGDEDKYFFKSVFKKIFDDSSITLDKLKGFKEFCDSFRPYKWLKDNNNKTTRYKQTFLYNAFAPIDNISGFIDIVFAAYNDDSNIESGFFDETYEESPESYIKFVKKYSDKLKNYSENDEQVCLYGGSYKLSTAFRHAFMWDERGVSRLISKTIGYINDFLKQNLNDDGTYFYKIVNRYLSQRVKEIKNNKNNYKYVEKVRSINDWYAYYSYDLDSHKLNINLPLLKLESLDQYKNLNINLILNDKVIKKETLEVVGEDYNPHIKSISFDITNEIIKNIEFAFKIDVFDGEKLLFTTKNNLFRDYMIFSINSIRENKDLYIKPNIDELTIITSNPMLLKNITSNYARNEHLLKAYMFIPNSGDYIESNNRKTIFIDEKANTNYRVQGNKVNYVTFEFGYFNSDIYNFIDSFEIYNSYILSESTNVILRLEHFSDDFTSIIQKDYVINLNKKDNRSFLINSIDYEELNCEGYNKFKILTSDYKKTIVSFPYYIANIKVMMEERIPKDNLVHVTLKYKDNILIDNNYDINIEKVRCQFDKGLIMINIPLLSYKFDGLYDSKKFYLSSKMGTDISVDKKILYQPKDSINCFLDINIAYLTIKNTYDSDFSVYVDDFEIEKNDNKFKVGKFINDSIRDCNNIYIKIFNTKYLIYTIFKKEVIDSDNIILEYENHEFNYSIHDFIGEEEPYFCIKIFDDEGKEYQSPILDKLSGNFEIRNFKPGYYYYKVIKMKFTNDWEEDKVLLELDSDYDDPVILGDVIPIMFENEFLELYKIPKHSIKSYYLRNINFYKYDENKDPIFIGYLNGKNLKKQMVFFTPKERTLKMYFDEEMSVKFYCDDQNKLLVKNKINDNDKPISSVYFKEENYV